MLPLRRVPVLLALGLLSVPASAVAQTPAASHERFVPRGFPAFLPSTAQEATRIAVGVDPQGRLRLTARAYRHIGRDAFLTVSCGAVRRGVLTPSWGHGTLLRRRADSAIPLRRADACLVTARFTRRLRDGGSLETTQDLGSLALTARGVTGLRRMYLGAVVVTAHERLADAEPSVTAADAAKELGVVPVLKRRVAARAMATPDAPLAAGELGLWRQGTRTVVATTTPEGERLYVDRDAATQTTATTLYGELLRDWGLDD